LRGEKKKHTERKEEEGGEKGVCTNLDNPDFFFCSEPQRRGKERKKGGRNSRGERKKGKEEKKRKPTSRPTLRIFRTSLLHPVEKKRGKNR